LAQQRVGFPQASSQESTRLRSLSCKSLYPIGLEYMRWDAASYRK
jgi:hypothetical protein